VYARDRERGRASERERQMERGRERGVRTVKRNSARSRTGYAPEAGEQVMRPSRVARRVSPTNSSLRSDTEGTT